MTLQTGVIGAWGLNDAASAPRLDASGNGRTLSDNNGVGTATGLIGNCAQFDGAFLKFLSRADEAALNVGGAFSVVAWLKETALANTSALVGKWLYPTAGGWVLAKDTVSPSEFMFWCATALNDTGTTFARTAGAALLPNVWNLVVVTFDGSLTGNSNRLKAYVNGAAVTLTFTGTIPATILTNTAPLEYGRWNGLGRYFTGLMDAPVLYGRVLSAFEVVQLYSNRVGQEWPYGGAVAAAITTPFWAKQLFRQYADLYRPVGPTHTSDHRGKPSNSYVAAYTGAPVFFKPTDNVNEYVPGVGLVKGHNLLTIDAIWFPIGQEIGNRWVVVDRTLNLDGTHSPSRGTVYTLQGDPKVLNSLPGIPMGHIEAREFTTGLPPTGVVV